jgi:hypothetical protein
MNDTEITEGILKIIARGDDDFQEQFAKSLGIELEEFQDYLDNVIVPEMTRKNRLDI